MKDWNAAPILSARNLTRRYGEHIVASPSTSGPAKCSASWANPGRAKARS
jgi:hypothetical protein